MSIKLIANWWCWLDEDEDVSVWKEREKVRDDKGR